MRLRALHPARMRRPEPPILPITGLHIVFDLVMPSEGWLLAVRRDVGGRSLLVLMLLVLTSLAVRGEMGRADIS